MKTRHFEFDADDHLPQHVDAEALQRDFDAEQAERLERAAYGVWAQWGLPLALIASLAMWAIAASVVIDWISAHWLTTIN